MVSNAVKSIVLGVAITTSTATSVFAQELEQAHIRPNFNCGPHTLTYVVKPLDQRPGRGIRCVEMIEGNGVNRIPKLAWYGEGNWNGATYRHVGQAFYRGRTLVGYASDINGNGENIHNNFPGNLRLTILNPSTIRVTGAWNEEWQLVNSTFYKPLPRPQTCGSYFDQYQVSDLTGNRQGSGLRCVLREGVKNTTWFGNGNWGGSTYSHIGTRSSNGYGASDICAPGFGPICNTFSWGSLKLNPVGGGFDVTGAWSEKWR